MEACMIPDIVAADIGCAFGNLLFTLMAQGCRSKIIGVDIEQKHLDYINEKIINLKTKRTYNVELINGDVSSNIGMFSKYSLDKIHVSHVLEYMSPDKLEMALRNIYFWLKDGGELFISCYSIFIKELSNNYAANEFKQRKSNNIKWIGYLEDMYKYNNLDYDAQFPISLHFFELDELRIFLENIGFTVIYASYMDGEMNNAHPETICDGREYIGIIARK